MKTAKLAFTVTHEAVKALCAAANGVVAGGVKVAALLRATLPATGATPHEVESAWNDIINSMLYDALENPAKNCIKVAMARRRSDDNYGLVQSGPEKGKIVPKAPKVAVAPRTPGQTKSPDTDKPAMNDALVVKRFAELVAAFITNPDDKLVAVRIIAAVSNQMALATSGKRK